MLISSDLSVSVDDMDPTGFAMPHMSFLFRGGTVSKQSINFMCLFYTKLLEPYLIGKSIFNVIS